MDKRVVDNLPRGWIIAKLSDMVVNPKIDFVDGPFGSNLKASEYITEGVPVFKIQNIKAGHFLDKNIQFISKEKAEQLSRHSFEIGDLIVTKLGEPLGLCCKVPAQYPYGIIVADLMRIRPSSLIVNTDYLVYAINSKFIRRQFEGITKGTTRSRVNLSMVRDLQIPLAPLEEQVEIVKKLDEFSTTIQNSLTQINYIARQLTLYKQAILALSFQGGVTEEWRSTQLNLKGTEEVYEKINSYRQQLYIREVSDYKIGARRTKPKKPTIIKVPNQSEISKKTKLPLGWQYVRLRDVCSEVERVMLKDKSPDDKFLYLDIGGINNKKNKIQSYKNLKWGEAPSRAQQIVQQNDILFSTVRTYLKNIALVEDANLNGQIASSGFAVIRPIEEFIHPIFLFNYLLSDTFTHSLNELQSGSSYPAVRNSDIFDQLVPVCEITEQKIIIEKLDFEDSLIRKIEDANILNAKRIENFKDSIVQNAFDGKLTDQTPGNIDSKVRLKTLKERRQSVLSKKVNRLKVQKKPMKEELKEILDILKETNGPISAKTVWQSSVYKDNIQEFYMNLKVHIENKEVIEADRSDKESFLMFAKK